MPAKAGHVSGGREEWFRITLASIGEAVVTADAGGGVIDLNPTAESMTGWTQAEASGVRVADVVRIVDDGGVAPADHSLLVARDGTERPIDHESTPILDAEGASVGVVHVFRDVAERRRLERISRDSLEYASEIIATLREPFVVLDRELRVRSANASFYRDFRVSEAETEGRFLYELGDGQWDVPGLRALLEGVRSGRDAVEDFEVEHEFPGIGARSMLLNARRFPPEAKDADLILLAIEDVTERKRADRAVKESELRFRRLFQTAKDGILILETDEGTIVEANPFMSGLLGYEIHEFVGKHLWEIGLFQDEGANHAAYRELIEHGYIRYENLPLKTKGGDEVEVEFVSNVYMVGPRRVAQCNIRDITARSRLERQTKAQSEELADLHRRKDEFLAMLSHELRNPLAPILNAVHLLRTAGAENPIQQQARGIIERQVGQLSRLVNDLMEVSRITTGRVRLQSEDIDMKGVVDRAVESARPLIDRRRHALTVTLPPGPIWLHADPARIEQVVVNLLNNAAKYTDEGGQIWVDAREESAEMVLSVRDTGVGINLDLFPDIFDLFTQADRSLDRAQGGLGIGLALVRRLVELHRGTVEVKSDGLGLGSEFLVRLPLRTTAQPPPPEAEPAPRPDAARILVVDDNVDAAEILAILLGRSGLEVRTAYTGPEALEVAAALTPDVVVLDIGLPGLNGYEVARRLRRTPRLEGVRLVALTGYGQESDIQLTREAGFDRHLIKPVDFNSLQEVLAELLSPTFSG